MQIHHSIAVLDTTRAVKPVAPFYLALGRWRDVLVLAFTKLPR